MFLVKRFAAVARRPCIVTNLAQSFRALTIGPQLLQHPKRQYEKPEDSDANITATNDQKECQDVFNKVNHQLAAGEEGRLFAVVHLCGKQFKITAGDIILVEGYWPPNIGDKLSLDKVLLAGSRDFTLIGSPILASGLINVTATVIEKTLTHTKTHFKKKRRKQFMRINFQRSPNTMIRINSIEVKGDLNKLAPEKSDIRLF